MYGQDKKMTSKYILQENISTRR